jgi:hypothetical protein
MALEAPTRPTRPTTDDDEPASQLLFFVLFAVAACVVPFAVASLTTGALNSITWFAFCVAAAAAIMGAIALFLRLGDWALGRARRSVRKG